MSVAGFAEWVRGGSQWEILIDSDVPTFKLSKSYDDLTFSALIEEIEADYSVQITLSEAQKRIHISPLQ